jgi:hypothetical protein
MKDNDITNIMAIVIAVIVAVVVICISDNAIVVIGTANRIWAIEVSVLGAATVGCLLNYISKQRAKIPPTLFDNLSDIGTPLFTGYISMLLYTYFASGSS